MNINEKLKQFGLNEKEIKIYDYLVKNGEQSILKIAKNTQIPRTNVYRYIETLIKKDLIVESIDFYGSKFSSTGINGFRTFLLTEQQKVDNLQSEIPFIQDFLNTNTNLSTDTSQIKNYKGVEGIIQVTYNSTLAKEKKLYLFEIGKSLANFVPLKTAEKIRKEFVKNKIVTYQLTNHKHIQSFTQIYQHVENWKLKYLNPKVLKITNEILIYDEVLCMYGEKKTTKNSEIFCVEIKNKMIAQMMKSIFKAFFKKAKKMSILNKKGEAKLL